MESIPDTKVIPSPTPSPITPNLIPEAQNPEIKFDQAPVRGKFLIIMIATAALGAAYDIFSKILILQGSLADNFSLSIVLSIFLDVLLAITLVGIWQWKKIAIYALIIILLAEGFIFSLMLNPLAGLLSGPTMFILLLAYSLFNIAVWLWALKDKWKFFN